MYDATTFDMISKISEYADEMAKTIAIPDDNGDRGDYIRRETTEEEHRQIKALIEGALHAILFYRIQDAKIKFIVENTTELIAMGLIPGIDSYHSVGSQISDFYKRYNLGNKKDVF